MGAASCASLDALGDLRQRARARWLGRGARHAGRLGLTPNKAQAARHHPFPVLCFWFAWGGRGWHRRPVHVAPCGGLAPPCPGEHPGASLCQTLGTTARRRAQGRRSGLL